MYAILTTRANTRSAIEGQITPANPFQIRSLFVVWVPTRRAKRLGVVAVYVLASVHCIHAVANSFPFPDENRG